MYLYEVLLIIDPRFGDEEASQIFTRLQDNAKGLGAVPQGLDIWGKRHLAYEIRKQREGIYAVIELLAEPVTLREIERQLRLNESVLRFISVRVPTRKRARQANVQEPPKAEEVPEEVT